ncbi:MAG: RnfH family protein [Rudaea sp.]
MPETIRVEVAYADVRHQVLREIELPRGSTVADAVQASAVLDIVPAPSAPMRYGVFGRIVATDTLLRDGDRVELYRRLKIDPKEARRERVMKQRKK